MAPKERSFVVRADDTEVAVELTADGVAIVGTRIEFQVEPAGRGEYAVRDGDRAWRVYVAGPPESRHVFVDGVATVLEVAPAGRPTTRRRTHDVAATAPMPATVLEILVSAGNTVGAGDVLLKLEAMKMELPVRAPRAGVVTAVHCAAGDLVQPGIVLVDIT